MQPTSSVAKSKVRRWDTPEFEILGLCPTRLHMVWKKIHYKLPREGRKLAPDKGGRRPNEDVTALSLA